MVRLHPNEVTITSENLNQLLAEAETHGKAHVLALKEQIARQTA